MKGLIIKRFQKLCHAHLPLTLTKGTDLLFEKLRHKTGGTPFALSLLGWRFHAMPIFFFNISSNDQHIGTLIIGLYLVCLIIGQTLGEGTI